METLSEQKQGRMDRALLALTLCLVAIGILMVYSSSHLLSSRHYDGYSFRYLQIHIIACVLGLVGMYMASYFPYRFYARYANLFLILSFVMLLLVFVPNLGSSVQGAEGGRFKRWIRIGNLPINFQPVEFAKIALVIHVANFISRNPERLKSLFNGVLPNMLIVAAAFGLVVSQPDFGSAFLLAVTVCIVLFVGGMRIWHVLTLSGIGGGLLSVLIIRDPYKLKRVVDYLAMLKSPDATNYHLTRSLDALEGGGLLGLGIDSSLQKISRLPYPHTDFIFAVLGEEFGFVGAAAVTIIFMLFIWRGTSYRPIYESSVRVSARYRPHNIDRFASLYQHRCCDRLVTDERHYVTFHQLWRFINRSQLSERRYPSQYFKRYQSKYGISSQLTDCVR